VSSTDGTLIFVLVLCIIFVSTTPLASGCLYCYSNPMLGGALSFSGEAYNLEGNLIASYVPAGGWDDGESYSDYKKKREKFLIKHNTEPILKNMIEAEKQYKTHLEETKNLECESDFISLEKIMMGLNMPLNIRSTLYASSENLPDVCEFKLRTLDRIRDMSYIEMKYSSEQAAISRFNDMVSEMPEGLESVSWNVIGPNSIQASGEMLGDYENAGILFQKEKYVIGLGTSSSTDEQLVDQDRLRHLAKYIRKNIDPSIFTVSSFNGPDKELDRCSDSLLSLQDVQRVSSVSNLKVKSGDFSQVAKEDGRSDIKNACLVHFATDFRDPSDMIMFTQLEFYSQDNAVDEYNGMMSKFDLNDIKNYQESVITTNSILVTFNEGYDTVTSLLMQKNNHYVILGTGTEGTNIITNEDGLVDLAKKINNKIKEPEAPLPKSGSQTSQEIPSWVKNNARWWAEGEIGESSFIDGIEWLIKNGVIKVTTTTSGSQTSQEIPSWVKNNARWWAEGEIGESSFIDGIEWLIKNGIVRI